MPSINLNTIKQGVKTTTVNLGEQVIKGAHNAKNLVKKTKTPLGEIKESKSLTVGSITLAAAILSAIAIITRTINKIKETRQNSKPKVKV